MKIALAHFRVGETDGVSLEMEKWKIILERMGHEVIFLAGSEGTSSASVIEELHYQHPTNNKFVTNAYDELKDYKDEGAFKEDVFTFASIIENKLIDFIQEEGIDLLVPNNILSLGWGLPAGIGFTKAIERTGVMTVCHHHDFHWERERYSHPTCTFVSDALKTYFPPELDHVHHVVINHIAKQELSDRYGIEAHVVPNVFDFSKEPWKEDEFNKDFRQSLGVEKNDLLILQATRIAERKAIELGIEFVAALQGLFKHNHPLYNGQTFTKQSKIVYVLAGLHESTDDYLRMLKKKAGDLGVDLRFANEQVDHSRTVNGEHKIYSLWDAYVAADFITYPSILEGWGNQLLEGIFAKKPMVVYEYPVFGTDIKDKNLSLTSLGSKHTLDRDGLVEVGNDKIGQAAQEAMSILTNEKTYQKIADKNFLIAKEYYSYEALSSYLLAVLNSLNSKNKYV